MEAERQRCGGVDRAAAAPSGAGRGAVRQPTCRHPRWRDQPHHARLRPARMAGTTFAVIVALLFTAHELIHGLVLLGFGTRRALWRATDCTRAPDAVYHRSGERFTRLRFIIIALAPPGSFVRHRGVGGRPRAIRRLASPADGIAPWRLRRRPVAGGDRAAPATRHASRGSTRWRDLFQGRALTRRLRRNSFKPRSRHARLETTMSTLPWFGRAHRERTSTILPGQLDLRPQCSYQPAEALLRGAYSNFQTPPHTAKASSTPLGLRR